MICTILNHSNVLSQPFSLSIFTEGKSCDLTMKDFPMRAFFNETEGRYKQSPHSQTSSCFTVRESDNTCTDAELWSPIPTCCPSLRVWGCYCRHASTWPKLWVGPWSRTHRASRKRKPLPRLTLSHLTALSPSDIGLTIDWILPLFSPAFQWDHSPQVGNITSQLKLCSSQIPGQRCDRKTEH